MSALILPQMLIHPSGPSGTVTYMGKRFDIWRGNQNPRVNNLSYINIVAEQGGGQRAPLEGELVLVFIASNGPSSQGATGGTGWTDVPALYANDSSDTLLAATWKVMGSTPDTSVSIASSGNANHPYVAWTMLFSGVDPSNPIDLSIATHTATSTILANPPASGVPTAAGAMVAVAGAGGGNTDVRNTSFSSSDLDNFDEHVNDVSDLVIHLGVGTKATNGASIDPAAFTMADDNTEFSNASFTITLRPS